MIQSLIHLSCPWFVNNHPALHITQRQSRKFLQYMVKLHLICQIPCHRRPPRVLNYLRYIEGDRIRTKYKVASIEHQFSWTRPGFLADIWIFLYYNFLPIPNKVSFGLDTKLLKDDSFLYPVTPGCCIWPFQGELWHHWSAKMGTWISRYFYLDYNMRHTVSKCGQPRVPFTDVVVTRRLW